MHSIQFLHIGRSTATASGNETFMTALPNSSRETLPNVDIFPGGGRGSNCPTKSRWGVLCPGLITFCCQRHNSGTRVNKESIERKTICQRRGLNLRRKWTMRPINKKISFQTTWSSSAHVLSAMLMPPFILKVSNPRVHLLLWGLIIVSVEKFCKNFKIEINLLTEDDMEFDMIGIDASIANAFRRILIAEVPTMAIEKIFMVDNTSVIADEVLSHRLGLIPLHADPRLFYYISENDVPNERNTIVYKLHVSCPKGSQRITVKSSELEWLPEGSQLSMAAPAQSGDKQKTFTSFSQSQKEILEKPLGVKFKDITIARLGPGQAIELEAHAVKGVGKVHANWSPVATAWYRMLPEVVILEEIEGDDAEELVNKCPVNVFDIEDLGNGGKRAVVAKPRACTLCRECVMGPNGNQVELRRVRDHFIFTIESTGALPPEVLFTEAVKILEEKCERVISELS